MHVYIYKTNFLVGLSCWITYEVIILSDSFNVVIPPFIMTNTALIKHRCSLISRQYSLQYSQVIHMYMTLVYLLSLPPVFVYFLDITGSILKNSSMKKKTNHHNDFMSLKNLYNKWVALTARKMLKSLSKTDWS